MPSCVRVSLRSLRTLESSDSAEDHLSRSSSASLAASRALSCQMPPPLLLGFDFASDDSCARTSCSISARIAARALSEGFSSAISAWAAVSASAACRQPSPSLTLSCSSLIVACSCAIAAFFSASSPVSSLTFSFSWAVAVLVNVAVSASGISGGGGASSSSLIGVRLISMGSGLGDLGDSAIILTNASSCGDEMDGAASRRSLSWHFFSFPEPCFPISTV